MRSLQLGAIGSFVLLFGVHAAAEPPESSKAGVLPLTSLRLFENGVGYFERQGVIKDARGALLPIPASHVDDALKTLVVLSGGKASVQGIELASVMPDGTARALAGLPADAEKPLDFENLLTSLKGYTVEVVTKQGTFRGRLLDIELLLPADSEKSDDAPKNPELVNVVRDRTFSLVVVDGDGSLRRVRTSDMTSLRPLDAGFSSRLQTALSALSGRSAQLTRELRVQASGSAPVRLGYVAETPVWRTSYRLVLGTEDAGGLLQGWALVHNDTDEAWQNVSIELVNGRRESLLCPLAAPRYARRELRTPEEELSTVPQLARHTPDAIWGDNLDDAYEVLGSGGLSAIGYGAGGAGVGHGRLDGSHAIRAAATQMSTGIAVGDLAQIAEAAPRDEGMLFSYSLTERVSLRAPGSALLPFVSKPLDTTRLSWFDGPNETGQATVLVVNRSANTLPAGPMAIFEAAGYSGEAMLDRMTPGERAFLHYGTDLDTSLTVAERETGHEVKLVRWEGEKLAEHFVRRTDLTLHIENRGSGARTVAYALRDIVNNADVQGADKLEYDRKESVAVAFVSAKGRATLERTLKLQEAMVKRHALAELTPSLLRRLAAAPNATPGHSGGRDTLLRIAAGHAEIETHLANAARLRERETRIKADLERHRGYLAAARESDAGEPIAERVLELEAELTKTRKSAATEDARANALRTSSRKLLESLR